MNSTTDSGTYALNANVSANYPLIDASPLTEVFNPTISGGRDLLFGGVKQISGGSACTTTGNSCLVVIYITSSFPTSGNVLGRFQTSGKNGFSGVIVDNVSGAAGASQVYFGALDASNGVQASQSALQ